MRKIIVCFFMLVSICILSCKSTKQNANETIQENKLDATEQELQKKEEERLERQKKIQEERKQKQEEKEKRIKQFYESIASEHGYKSFDEFIDKNSIPYDKFKRTIETRSLSTFPFEKGNIILVPSNSAVVIQESDMLLTISTKLLDRYRSGEINSQTVGIYETTEMFFLESDKQLKSPSEEEVDEEMFIEKNLSIRFYDEMNIRTETVIKESFYMEYIGERNTGAGRRAAVRPVFKYLTPFIK